MRKTKEYSSLSIEKSDSALLNKLCNILGKKKATLIHEYLKAISPYVVSFKSASLIFDDSDTLLTDNVITIKIKISGVRSLEFGTKKVSEE